MLDFDNLLKVDGKVNFGVDFFEWLFYLMVSG